MGAVGPWEVFHGTGMPEQQKHEVSTYLLERWTLWQVPRLGWITIHVCVCNSLIRWGERGVWGAAGCRGMQHHTGLNESMSSDLGK